MEKLYTQKEYQVKSDEANKKGLFLYQLVSEKEYIEEVLEWEKKIIEIEIIDPETGEPTGETQLQEVNDYDRPIMIEEEIINPETGLKEVVIVQKHHSELKTKKVANLIIADKDYYICFEKNFTYGEINFNYEAEKEAKEQQRIAMLSLTAADVERGIYKATGKDFDDVVALVTELQPVGLDIKALKIELKANNFYRGNPYVDAVGSLLGFTKEQLDEFFETNDYIHLLSESEILSEDGGFDEAY